MEISQHLLAEWLLRGVALSVVAAGAYVLLKPGGRARGTLLGVTTAGLLFLPLALWAGPRWTLGWISLYQKAVPAEFTSPGGEGIGNATAGGWVMVWLLGAAICLARIAIGFWTLRKCSFGAEIGSRRRETDERPHSEILRVARCAARELGIRLPRVILMESNAGAVGPFATGLVRPKIYLPADATTWTPTVLRAVLLHEMAHLRRGDLWMQAAGNLVCAVYWFNPLVWFLHRWLSREREYLADALVVETGTDARSYAHALLDIAGSCAPVPVGATAGIGLAGASRLEDRVRRLIGKNSGSTGRFRLVGAAVIGFAAVAASACLDPFAQPPEPLVPPAAGEEEGGGEWTAEEIERRLSASPFPGG